MIGEVRGAGGQVSMGVWHPDEDGLFLPGFVSRVIGEAWTGRINQAAIPQHAFNSDNVAHWCLDEVRWLGVASDNQSKFEVDSQALAAIPSSDSLWIAQFEDGYLDAECMRQLARFPKLIDLRFDCNSVRYRLKSKPLRKSKNSG